MNRDPIGYLGSRWNLYEYAANPAKHIDPTGLTVQDSRGVTARYCDAMRKNPKNKWLKCACRVSHLIDGAMAGFFSTLITIGRDDPDYGHTLARAKWFRCMRSCMVKKWQAAQEKWEGKNNNGKPSTAWQDFIDNCPCDKISTRECCVKQVEAEQDGFEDCTKKCGRWKWGDSFPVGQMPGWDPKWDFDKLQDRIKYGVQECCDGNAFGPKPDKETK